MHVPSNRQGRQRWRPPTALLLMTALAGLTAVAQAVEFDERVRAPLVRDSGELRTQAQSFSTRVASLRDAASQEFITNRALSGERFDLAWQIQNAIDVHQPLGDLSAIGLESRDDGGYFIDYNANPQWQKLDELMAGLLREPDWQLWGGQLILRGFRAEDVAKLKEYAAKHDAHLEAVQKTLPLAVSFSKLVRKFDKLKRPVPDSLVLSYVYQRARIEAESTRAWADGLLQTLDAQRARILVSIFQEMPSNGLWAPSNQRAGIDGVLGAMRLPNFEQLATAEAKGVKP